MNNVDIDDDSGIKSAYGNAIDNQVFKLQNLYNTEDDVLERDTSECLFIGFLVVGQFAIPIMRGISHLDNMEYNQE